MPGRKGGGYTPPEEDTGGGGGSTLTQAQINAAAAYAGVAPSAIVAALQSGQLSVSQIQAMAKANGGVGGPSGGGEAGGGGGGTSSGGASSGGGGGSSLPDPQAIRNAVAGYENMLSAWGIPIDASVRRFIQQSVMKGLNSAAFLAEFRKTKAYAKTFPGLVKANGALRMTESQYIAGYNQAKDYAATIGRGLSKDEYGFAIKQGNSPSEIKQKLLTIDKLKSYGPQLAEFNDYLMSTGQIKKPLSRKDLEDFIMGYRGDLQQSWAVANTAFHLQEQAGVNVGKPGAGGEVSYRELKSMLKRFQSLGGDPEQVDFIKMGALISETLPKSALYGAGITKKNIVNMMLNGKDAGEITKRVQRVLDTYEAAVTEPGAQAPTYAGQVHLGTPGRGASE